MIAFLGLLALIGLFLVGSMALHLYLHAHRADISSAEYGPLPRKSPTAQLHEILFQHQ